MEQKTIRSTAVIGLGALGTIFAKIFAEKAEESWVIADRARIQRYQREGVFYNGEKLNLRYLAPEDAEKPADLILVCTKFHHLSAAMEEMRPFVGKDTLILSLINGITSEAILGRTFGDEKVIPCIAQGMSAVKLGPNLECKSCGTLAVGEISGVKTERLARITAFFDKACVSYVIPPDMRRHMWGKLMTNVGCNQILTVFEGGYGVYQHPGPAREMMLAAMREVMAVAEKEGVPLTEEDLTYWLGVLDTLPPDGMASMRQDSVAGRKTEVELFAGTVSALGRKHGVPTPVSDRLLKTITEMERAGMARGKEQEAMDALETIFTRKSVRDFTDRRISDEDLNTILKAGMSGPSCVNCREWTFLVVRDKAMLAKMADGNGRYAAPLKGADVGILVCGDMERAHKPDTDYWVIDESIACQNMILAANALGIGSVWLGTYPVMSRVKSQSELFHLPETVIPHSIVAFGYEDPAHFAPAKDSFEPDRIHWEKY